MNADECHDLGVRIAASLMGQPAAAAIAGAHRRMIWAAIGAVRPRLGLIEGRNVFRVVLAQMNAG